jgi:ligand-binding sensor domain-containing protein
LADTVVTSVCEDSDGNVWIGTVGGTLARWRDGRCTNITVPGKGRIRQNVVVCPDRQGRLWVGTEGSGVYIYEHDEFKEVPLDLGEATVRVILADRKGAVWVGSAHSLYRCEANERTLVHRGTAELGGYIASLAETEDGSIWMGTDEGCLFRYSGRQFELVPQPADSGKSRFWSLWPAGEQALWIGTYASGLWRYQAGVFRQYDQLLSVPEWTRVSAGLTDEEGNLWMGTRGGIVRVAKGAFEAGTAELSSPVPVRVFGRGDGLLTIGTSVEYQPRCWKGRDGRLWFGMTNGVAYVDPKDVRANFVPPTVVLEEVQVDGQLVPGSPGMETATLLRSSWTRVGMSCRFVSPLRAWSPPTRSRFVTDCAALTTNGPWRSASARPFSAPCPPGITFSR